MTMIKYTVETLNQYIKDNLENNIDDIFSVEGEVSNLKITNGNVYMTLKYKNSSINTIGWGSHKLLNNTDLSNGDKIEVTGHIYFYTKTGSTNLNIKSIKKIGFGDIFQNYESIKNECNKLGYFDKDRKKRMPDNINNIGIITAPEGAAIQDILFVLKQNKFYGNVVIKRCTVQGATCPLSIIDSINYFNDWRDIHGNTIDILMIARGGGSFEDLMGFSDMRVIESMYKCKYFTISAIGHEVDFMLSDFVADVRAPTPSIGAEIISTQQKKTSVSAKNLGKNILKNIKDKMIRHVELLNRKFENVSKQTLDPIQILNEKMQQIQVARDRINNEFMKNMKYRMCVIDSLMCKLHRYDTNKNMKEGYTMAVKHNKLISSTKDLIEGEKLNLIFQDGSIEVIIKKIVKNEQ